jgi:hypothetical protein
MKEPELFDFSRIWTEMNDSLMNQPTDQPTQQIQNYSN